MVFLSRILVLLIHVSFCSLSSAVPWISATRLEHPVKAWMATFKGGGAAAATVPNHQKLVEEEIASPRTSYEPRSYPSNVADAANDFDAHLGQEAYQFLYGLASSQTFVDEFWHKKPLLLRNVGEWVKGAFTVEKDLKLIGGSFIAGHRTADVVRNGTDTTTCHFCPIKDNPARPTTWEEVEEALKGGTIYFNTAGSLWPNLGGLCRLTIAAFGLPANVNVYVTPPGQGLSVPPHTDRQDVIVFQTQGAKRWRVYAPPKRQKKKDPLNRGKAGDVLSFEEELDDQPLIDTVLRAGDILYVPTGFPHTTDTCTVVDSDVSSDDMFEDTLLQRNELEFNLEIENDKTYWDVVESIPVGFLRKNDSWHSCLEAIREGRSTVPTEARQSIIDRTKELLVQLEPDRWRQQQEGGGDDNVTGEELPNNDSIGEVVDYYIMSHLKELMEIQEEMFSGIKMYEESSLIKAFQCSQRQNAVMEKFGGFSKNKGVEESFGQMRSAREKKVFGSSGGPS